MNIKSKMKRILLLFAVVTCAFFTHSCTEEIDTSARYTFTGNTIISYLQSHSEYSEYCTLLEIVKISDRSTSTLSQLLSARGQYTCFAPTNDAIYLYLAGMKDEGVISQASWDAPEFIEDPELLDKTRKNIVYNSLIDNGDANDAYQTTTFSEANETRVVILPQPNMKYRKLQVTRVTDDESSDFAVSGCKISNTNCDIYTINGRIHQVAQVVSPSDATATDYFRQILEDKKPGYYVYASLLDACGLLPELAKIEDEEYYRLKMIGNIKNHENHPTFDAPGKMPEHRYYGYTLFLEDDSWWKTVLGIGEGELTDYEPAELVGIVSKFVADNNLHLSGAVKNENYKDENNALNQFVTYHILPAKIEPQKLVIHYNELFYKVTNTGGSGGQVSVFDYYTTMGKRRLLKTFEPPIVYGEGRKGVVFVNRFSELNNERKGNYGEKSCTEERRGIEINTKDVPDLFNAYIYNIKAQPTPNGALHFNDNIAKMMAGERIRIDVSTFFKELMTNDIRCNEVVEPQYQCVGIPVSETYNYLEDCHINRQSKFYYLTGRIRKDGSSCWQNYQGDELNIVGNYEITMKLPPVPRSGIYELRMGVSANNRRGMCQIYWGTNKDQLPAAGIPLDLRMSGEKWNYDFENANNTGPSIVGWKKDVSDEIANSDNDKIMRNNGYMKAPRSYWLWSNGEKDPNGNIKLDLEAQIMRHKETALRRIILREWMEADQTYYIQFKSVLSNDKTEFYLDYLEFCHKDIYDNPTKPEDIW